MIVAPWLVWRFQGNKAELEARLTAYSMAGHEVVQVLKDGRFWHIIGRESVE